MRLKFLIFLMLPIFFITAKAQACVDNSTDKFELTSLTLDYSLLQNLCQPENCLLSADNIKLKAQADEEMSVEIYKDGFIAFTKKRENSDLSAAKVQKVQSEASAKPAGDNWSNVVDQELKFLKNIKVLDLETGEIQKLSQLSSQGEKILYCDKAWKAVGSWCNCNNICSMPRDNCASSELKLPAKRLVLAANGNLPASTVVAVEQRQNKLQNFFAALIKWLKNILGLD
jgi:hypothetical protein